MIIEGLKLMVLGMGVVFIFLLILYAIISVSAIILKPFTDSELAIQHQIQSESAQKYKPSVTENEEDETVLGGHAVMCVGYNDQMKRMIVRNSWSEEWGDSGYFYMPYSYISNSDLAADFWTIRKVANKEVKELKDEKFTKINES